MPISRRGAATAQRVEDPAPAIPPGRVAIHDEHPDQPVTILLYAHNEAAPLGRVTIERDTLLLYAHALLEAGLRRG